MRKHKGLCVTVSTRSTRDLRHWQRQFLWDFIILYYFIFIFVFSRIVYVLIKKILLWIITCLFLSVCEVHAWFTLHPFFLSFLESCGVVITPQGGSLWLPALNFPLFYVREHASSPDVVKAWCKWLVYSEHGEPLGVTHYLVVSSTEVGRYLHQI